MLITRPEPGASATAQRVAAMGLVPVVAPVLRVEALPVAWPEPASLRAILAASGNAVAAIPPAWRALPLLAVGDATARKAREAGFAHVESADGDARALAGLAAARFPATGPPLLLASGEGQGAALAAALGALGVAVIRREVYAARPVARLPDPAGAALGAGSLGAALFFSAETARAFAGLLDAAGLAGRAEGVEALAIGQPAAGALSVLPWRAIRVAARPTEDAMLAMLR